MAKISINSVHWQEVILAWVPGAKESSYFPCFPGSQFQITQRGPALCLVVPAFLGMEIYRRGVLPQTASAPIGRKDEPETAVMEPPTYVTDMTHYLNEQGELAQLPAPARKLASFLTLLIDEATGAFPAANLDSRIRCRTDACQGTIRITLAAHDDAITWSCPACRHDGIIRNWQNTRWNQLKQGGPATPR